MRAVAEIKGQGIRFLNGNKIFQFTGTVLIQGPSVKINGFREADPSFFLVFFVSYKKSEKILVVYSKKIEFVRYFWYR